VVQGPLHGSFGFGCIAGPVLAVALVGESQSWYYVYRLLLIFIAVELAVQLWAFWHDTAAIYRGDREHDQLHAPGDDIQHEASLEDDSSNADSDSSTDTTQSGTTWSTNPFLFRGTYMCALFFFVYVAIEFTYSDWIVVYMRRARHVQFYTAGFASSIFWLGMSIGRISLGPVSEYFGVKRSVAAYLSLSAILQLCFKLAVRPTLSLVILGFNGFMLGPTFPSGLVLLANAVPKQAQVRAVSVAAAIGQIGGAAVPFLIGFMAERIGIGRLLDVVLTLTAALILVWFIYCKIC
jgi:fucose permease